MHLVVVRYFIGQVCPADGGTGFQHLVRLMKSRDPGIHLGCHPQSFFAFSLKTSDTHTGHSSYMIHVAVVVDQQMLQGMING